MNYIEKKGIDKKKVILNGALFLIVFGLTIYAVFRGQDLQYIITHISQCKPGWILGAIVCVLVFIWGESIIIWYLMGSYGIRLGKMECFLYSSIGFFFSCLTPSATGGQPMQLYYMKKKDIPLPVSTVVLMIITITYKLVLVLIGLGIMIFAQGFLHEYLGKILFVFYLGIGLNIFCVVSMSILVFHPYLAKWILTTGAKLFERFHILKKKHNRLEKLEASMDLYNDTAEYMRTHFWKIVWIFMITLFQRGCMFAVTYFVYRSFSLSGESFVTITTLTAVIAVSVDMLPLPGGMGISESLFLKLFLPIFGESLLLPGMLLSRGLGYYSELLLSAIFTLVAVIVFSLYSKRKVQNKKEKNED